MNPSTEMTKPNTSCTIELLASLRSDGVRDHPGMPFGFIPDSAFGFAGIPSAEQTSLRWPKPIRSWFAHDHENPFGERECGRIPEAAGLINWVRFGPLPLFPRFLPVPIIIPLRIR